MHRNTMDGAQVKELSSNPDVLGVKPLVANLGVCVQINIYYYGILL